MHLSVWSDWPTKLSCCLYHQKNHSCLIHFNFPEPLTFEAIGSESTVLSITLNSYLIIQSIWHTLCLSYTVSSHPMKVARFHSTHKTIEILQSPCSNSPCLNGGTCVALYDKHDFMCACPTGFVGKTCEKEGKTKKETTSLKHPCAPICWWPRHG